MEKFLVEISKNLIRSWILGSTIKIIIRILKVARISRFFGTLLIILESYVILMSNFQIYFRKDYFQMCVSIIVKFIDMYFSKTVLSMYLLSLRVNSLLL